MDANRTQNRIFQERTNFKNLQGHNRLGLCTEESIPRGGATQQENGFMDIPRRRKSQHKILRGPLISNSNVWPGPVDVVLPTQEHGPTAKDEVLHGPVESVQDPRSRQARTHPITRPSQRVRADHALLSGSYNEAEADHTLKVAALTRVTSSLAAKASDAKQGVERLRKLLADRAVEPSIYEATQRERWMEERRQVATEELLKTVKDHLASVVQSPAWSLPQSISTTESEEEISPAAANLHIFLTSPHRPATRSSRRRRPYPAPLPEDAFNRIRHHKQLLPLRLKVPVHRPFSQPPPKAMQAPSMVTENPSSPAGSSALTEPIITNIPSPTSSSDATLHPSPSPAPVLDAIPETKEATQFSPLHRPLSPGNGNGMATIWRSVPLRSKEEILANMDMDTDMPDYVGNLLAELDSTPVARVRLNSLRRSASFPRRPVSPAAIARTPKRNSHANASSSNTKRNTIANTPVASNPPTHSLNIPLPTPTNANISPNIIHSSPSRRRLSVLFSVPEMLSSRRSVNIVHSHAHSPTTNPPSTSAQLPALTLVSPSIGFTIMESSQENEDEEEEISQEPAPEQQPAIVPIPPSTSAITLSSVGTAREARHSSVGVNAEEKILARLRRRMSSALGRQ